MITQHPERLAVGLQNTLEKLRPVQMPGQTGQQASTDSINPVSTLCSMSSSDIGNLSQDSGLESSTGIQPSRTVANLSAPKTADEAAELAEALVGALLPRSLSQWLDDMEKAERVMTSVGWHPPVKPERTPELLHAVMTRMQSLSELLIPARERCGELEMEIAKLFAVFNSFTGDEAKTKLQVSCWADDLEGYPLYAIRKAARWARRSENKMPSLSAFIADVKLAIGTNVLSRKKLLEGWIRA